MFNRYFLGIFPLLKNAKGNNFFKRAKKRFSEEVKNNIKVRYIKENKTKYIFYSLTSSFFFSAIFIYAYERCFLYKWNYKYDYYYNPSLRNSESEKKRTNKNGADVTDNTSNETENKQKKEKEKTVIKNVILVRHGQYERKFESEESKFLTKEGTKQADITGKKLKDILKNKKISVIYHSNIIRAIETAQIISKYFPEAKLINDPNLNEGTPYLPDPIPKNSKFEAHKIKEDNKRINKAYETYFCRPNEDEEDSYHLIICHGNVIRYFLCRALQLPLFAWLRFSSYNCGITWLVLDDEGSVVLREFGSVSHLPFESVTYY